MVEKLYYADQYLKRFEAKVEDLDGEKIFLDRTAFYPGGGGQAPDIGTLSGVELAGIGTRDGEIYHIAPNAGFRIGQKVIGEIDWNRRYDLMRGHSGQHILFRSIQEQNPEISVAKVDINSDKKSIFLNGDLSWEILRNALEKANQIIRDDLEVEIEVVPADSHELEDVRIKKDRIKGSEVRIIRIRDFDAAACGGVHVRRTGEIGGISITRVISGRQASDREVQFAIGYEALDSANRMAMTAQAIADILGCPVESLEATVSNLKENEYRLKNELKQISTERLDSIEPERIGTYSLYSSLLAAADRKSLIEKASEIVSEKGTVVLFTSLSDGAFMIVGCNEGISLDCPSLLKFGLDILGGKGGGKKNFAMGGSEDSSKGREAFDEVKKSITDILSSEESCG